MTGRKPRRGETTARRLRVAAGMREFLAARKLAAIERNNRERKLSLLLPEGGGSGVTVEMRRISAEAKQRPEIGRGDPNGISGPNRAERRHDPRYGRTRHTRAWIPPTPDTPGRWVWPTPTGPSQNTPYVSPRDPGTGDHA